MILVAIAGVWINLQNIIFLEPSGRSCNIYFAGAGSRTNIEMNCDQLAQEINQHKRLK